MFVLRRLVSQYCRYNAGLLIGRRGTYLPIHTAARFPYCNSLRFGGQIQGFQQLQAPPTTSSSYSSSIVNGAAVQRNKDSSQPPPPQSPVPNQPKNPFTRFIKWARWFVGSVLVWAVPFWKTRIQEIEDNVELAVDLVNDVVDVAETVAVVTEKVSSEIADSLPENAKLKEAVELVEQISGEAVEELEMAKDIINKVDDLREDVETLLENKSPLPEASEENKAG